MLDLLLLIVVFVFAVVLHEVAHGFSAYLLGDPTAKVQGRLTLNPVKHVDPVGSLLVPGAFFLAHYFGLTRSLMLFGWAKPVPVNFRNLRPQRWGMSLVAVAGPMTNIVLAFIFSKVYAWPALSNVPYINAPYICAMGVALNLTLAVFNMMPIPPLDGSRVVSSILPVKWAQYYGRLEPYGFIVVIVLLNLGFFGFLFPLIEQIGNCMGVQL